MSTATGTDRATNTTAGLSLAAVSAATFGTSGPLASSLMQAGWTPIAAVAVRVLGAAVVLAIPVVLAMRGRWWLMRANLRGVLAYGVFGVAAAQLGYFAAVTHLSVGVALLVEYLAPVLLVGYLWVRTGRRPGTLTLTGIAAALIGLLLVLDLTSGAHVDLVGVLWALGAAVGAVVYFVVASRDDTGLPPLLLAGTGMGVGGVALVLVAALGLLPLRASTDPVQLADRTTPWWVPVLGLAVVAAAVAYATGTAAARRLGPTLASFAAMTEVVFAVLFAWFALGQLPSGVQLVGGVFILGGVAAVRSEQVRAVAGAPEPVPAAPETAPLRIAGNERG